jgi:MFS transporter, OFA family, oxalate/formate antiporter
MHFASNLSNKVPFFYGWVIVGCSMCANFARQGSAVATLSVFAVPMTDEFNWSMTAISGAVSLGGVLGAIVSPKVGIFVDRRGPGQVLTIGTLLIGVSMIALSMTTSLIWFYIAYCLGRMTFAGPFEIANTSAVANWFIHLRARAMSFTALAHSIGLAVLPIVAFAAIYVWDWRAGWLAIAGLVLVFGVVPNFLFMIQRPEDVGLKPYSAQSNLAEHADGPQAREVEEELSFTREEASRTPTFWVLIAISVFIYPVQAGISLHQAPHYINCGLSLGVAASAVSAFSVMSAISALVFGHLEARFGVRRSLAVAAALMAIGAAKMLLVTNAWDAYLSAVVFGAGIGGLITLFPVAWSNCFGRENLGTIRGVTLPIQILAQATGPLLSGALFDSTGSYDASLTFFCASSCVAGVLALFAVRPVKSG